MSSQSLANDESQTKKPKRRSRGSRAYMVLATVVVLGLASYFGYAWYSGNQVSTDNAQVEADVLPIGARVGGAVLKMHVSDNQMVKQGDLIAEIDPRDFEIRVAQAEADLEAAEATAEAAAPKTGVVVNTAQIAAAQAALNRADAELRKAEADLTRARELKRANAISTVELEGAQNAVDRMRASKEQAAAQTKMAEEQHSVAAAKVKASQAALDSARMQLEYTKIRAPHDGVLSKVAAQEGQILQAGQLVAQLVDSQSYLVANFKETQIGRMREDQRVEITVDAYPGRHFEGRVASLAAATGARFSLLPPDNASGNFVKVVQRVPVKIVWVNPPTDVPLKAGLSAEAVVYLK